MLIGSHRIEVEKSLFLMCSPTHIPVLAFLITLSV
jgi:hypothetical protein